MLSGSVRRQSALPYVLVIFPRVNRSWRSLLKVVTAGLVLLPGAVRRGFHAAISAAWVRRKDEDADSPETHSEVRRYEPAPEVDAEARPPAPNLAAAGDDGFSVMDRASAVARNAWSRLQARLLAASQHQLQQGSEVDYVPRPPEKDPPA
jgi:hypothetical protein